MHHIMWKDTKKAVKHREALWFSRFKMLKGCSTPRNISRLRVSISPKMQPVDHISTASPLLSTPWNWENFSLTLRSGHRCTWKLLKPPGGLSWGQQNHHPAQLVCFWPLALGSSGSPHIRSASTHRCQHPEATTASDGERNCLLIFCPGMSWLNGMKNDLKGLIRVNATSKAQITNFHLATSGNCRSDTTQINIKTCPLRQIVPRHCQVSNPGKAVFNCFQLRCNIYTSRKKLCPSLWITCAHRKHSNPRSIWYKTSESSLRRLKSTLKIS